MRLQHLFVSLILVSLETLTTGQATAQGPEPLTLRSLFSAAREHNPSLAKQPLLSQSLSLERARVNRTYLPQLALNGKATWQSAVTEVDVPVPGVQISPPPKDQYQATLDLRQTIWDGGVGSDQKTLASSRTKVEQEKVQVAWYEVRERIIELYFGGIVQQELASQAADLQTYIGTLIEKTEILVEQGLAIERDVLLLQARRLEARRAHVDATKALEKIRRSLSQMTGTLLRDDAPFEEPRQNCATPEPGELQNKPVKRPELAVLSAEAESLRSHEKVARAGDRPKLGAFATAGYGRPGLNFLSSDFDFFFIGGVQLTVPLTHLYAGTHQNGDRQVAVRRALLEKQQDAVMMQVNVARQAQLAEISRLDEVLRLDEGLLSIRENARKQTEAQVALGTAATADLVSDLSQEDQAKSQHAVHLAQRSLACHELALVQGEL